VSAALLCLLTAFIERKRKYYLYAYTLMGFAFLAKGLIGVVVPMLVYGIFLLWTRSLHRIKDMALGWGMLIIAVITVPWVVAMSIREPEFIDVFIVQHHFVRFSSGHFGKHRPLWFYVPILFGGSFPWTLFAPAAFIEGTTKDRPDRIKSQFLIIWVTTVLIFFTIPGTKLPYYMLPARIPLAMLIGVLLGMDYHILCR